MDDNNKIERPKWMDRQRELLRPPPETAQHREEQPAMGDEHHRYDMVTEPLHYPCTYVDRPTYQTVPSFGSQQAQGAWPSYYLDPPVQSSSSRDLPPRLSFDSGPANHYEAEPSRMSPPAHRLKGLSVFTEAPAKTSRKRGVDDVSSRAVSPPATRIKAETSQITPSPLTSGRHDSTSSLPPINQQPAIALPNLHSSKALLFDPNHPDVCWQIRCIGTDFGRQNLADYLGFRDTRQIQVWEVSNPKRWSFIQSRVDMQSVRVRLTDMLRLICNKGGEAAQILAWLERLQPWEWAEGDEVEANVGKLQRLSAVAERSIAQSLFRAAAVVIRLIRECSDQFKESGWYATKCF
jgi:hypothetical protein